MVTKVTGVGSRLEDDQENCITFGLINGACVRVYMWVCEHVHISKCVCVCGSSMRVHGWACGCA